VTDPDVVQLPIRAPFRLGLVGSADPADAVPAPVAPLPARSPNRARTIADRLRTQIVTGQLPDGSTLPPLDHLMASMHASKASVRQALHILESEGILQVRRGRLGGSVVHRPEVFAGPAMESAFRAGDVAPEDMSEVLREIEPVCASFCARRVDRGRTVVPYLRRAHELSRVAATEDVDAWPRYARMFHEELVARCGNATMVLLMGAVESVCTSRATEWAMMRGTDPDYPTRGGRLRHRALNDHELILELIEAGDTEGAAREARRHLQWVPAYTVK
jgi:DNA-binding FadR family transcriptional regulator